MVSDSKIADAFKNHFFQNLFQMTEKTRRKNATKNWFLTKMIFIPHSNTKRFSRSDFKFLSKTNISNF